MSVTFLATPYVGLPFVKREGEAGFECWDLCVRVFREIAKIELPSYGEIAAKDLAAVAHAFSDGMASETWVSAVKPRCLDVVVMYARERGAGRRARHCGVMVDEARMLHLEVNTAAVVVPIMHPSVRFRIAGFFRHRNLA